MKINKFTYLLLILGFIILQPHLARANDCNNVEIPSMWCSNQQMCDCSFGRSKILMQPNANGLCLNGCSSIFPTNFDSLTEDDFPQLEESACEIAKYNLKNQKPADCENRTKCINYGVAYSGPQLSEGILAGYERNYGEALFHRCCTVKKIRACGEPLPTTIKNGPPPKGRGDKKLIDSLDPHENRLFRDGTEKIG